jgi:hypothetical protein
VEIWESSPRCQRELVRGLHIGPENHSRPLVFGGKYFEIQGRRDPDLFHRD